MSIKHVVRWGPFITLVMLGLGAVSAPCRGLSLLFLTIGGLALVASTVLSLAVVSVGDK